jgi:hypothetical protein
MTYGFEFDRREHVRACRAISRHAARTRVLRYVWRIGLGVFAMFVLINMAADLARGSFPAMLPALLIVVVATTVLPALSGYVAAQQWERLNRAGHRRVEFAFDGAGFRNTSHRGTLEIRWEAVMQVVETRDFLLFYITWQTASYLPTRAVPDLPALREAIRARVPAEHVHLLEEAGTTA